MAPQVLRAKPNSGYTEPGKESYEIIWTIPKWEQVQNSEDLLNRQEAVFETGSSSAWFRTKWRLSVHTAVSSNGIAGFAVYWTLMAISGPQSDKLEVVLETQLWNFQEDKPFFTDKQNKDVGVLEEVVIPRYFEWPTKYPGFIDSSGSMKYFLKVTLKTPTMNDFEFEVYKSEQFPKRCAEQLLRRQAALLNDHSETGYLKFVTSDGMEISAHKNILKVLIDG